MPRRAALRALALLLVLLGAVVPAAGAATKAATPLLAFDPADPDISVFDLVGFDPRPGESGFMGDGSFEEPFVLRFDGIDDALATSIEPRPAPEQLTLAVWFRATRSGGTLAEFADRPSGPPGNYDRFLYLSEDGRLHFGIYAHQGLVNTSQRLVDGAWHLAVGTLATNASGTLVALHVDGALVGERHVPHAPYKFDGWWRFGDGPAGTNSSARDHFRGDLGRAVVHEAVLSRAALDALYDEGPAGDGNWHAARVPAPSLERGLVLRLDPGAPLDAEDALSDYSDVGDVFPLANVTARGGGVMKHDGDVSRIAFRDGGHLTGSVRRHDPDMVTLSVWFRTTSTGGKLIGFEDSQRERSGNYDRHLHLDKDGRVVFHVYGSGSVVSGPGLADGEWHHVIASVGSRGSTTGMRLVVDDKLVDTLDANTKHAFDGWWRLGDGSVGGVTWWRESFRGEIAAARVYERVLTPEEETLLHAHGPIGEGEISRDARGLLAGLVFRYDASEAGTSGSVEDLGPLGNKPELDGVTVAGSGMRGAPHVFRFDGASRILTTTRMLDPDGFALSVWFRAEGPGKLVGFEDARSDRAGNYDRHLYVGADGRLHASIYAVGGSLASATSVLDGQWHHAAFTAGSRGSLEGLRLYLDGVEVAHSEQNDKQDYDGYWRIGSGSLSGVSVPHDTAFRGDIASVAAHERPLRAAEVAALAAASPVIDEARIDPWDHEPVYAPPDDTDPGMPEVDPPEATPTPQDDASPLPPRVPAATLRPTLVATGGLAEGGALRFRITPAGLAPQSGARLVAVAQDGTEHDIGAAEGEASWAPARAQSGVYRFEARDADGRVLASDTVVVLVPVASDGEVAAALAVGVGVAVAGSLAASRGFDILRFLRSVLFGNAAERLREKTRQARVESYVRWGSLASAALAVALMATLYALGKLDRLAPGEFVQTFLVVGTAVLVLKACQWTGLALLARTEGAKPSYRFWTSGTLSLALSALILRVPFGYTGFVSKARAPDAPPSTLRQDALASIAGFAVLALVVPLFLAIGAWTRFAFAETGISLALAGIAITSVPVRPLSGFAVWRWSRAAAVVVSGGAFAAYYLMQTGRMPVEGLVAVGALGAALIAAIVLARRARLA